MEACVVMALLWIPAIALGNCRSKDKFPKFEQFPVAEVFRSKVHAPVLKTRIAHMYRSQIRWAMKDGVNFAGHYVVARWGCGTGCAQFVIVDAITGNVIEPPFPNISFHHPFAAEQRWPDFDPEGKWWCEEYADWPTIKITSALLVVEGCISDRQCGRTFFVITQTKLKQVYFDPDRSPDGKVAPP
jgi:hypothetical protein